MLAPTSRAKPTSSPSKGRTSITVAGAVGDRRDLGADQIDPLLEREQRALADVDRDADHQPVQHPGGPADDVEMAVGDRVEGAGIDADVLALSHRSAPAARVIVTVSRRSRTVVRHRSSPSSCRATGNTSSRVRPRPAGTASRPSAAGRSRAPGRPARGSGGPASVTSITSSPWPDREGGDHRLAVARRRAHVGDAPARPGR